jgi:general secretion pathway protein F
MLNRAATNQERELDGIISALLAILEPALIVVMGLVVLAIVVSMLLPLFELNQLVG